MTCTDIFPQIEAPMRDKDLRRCAALVLRHRQSPQARAFAGTKEEWSAVKFIDWAIPLLVEAGVIGKDPTTDDA